MFSLIDIDKLKHHPKNPRQDYGDLTELAESIKTRGILQNLTVVPADSPSFENEKEYYVVIGNRRLEAAKLAGLEKLPCQISNFMSRKDQQAVMLLENMQRNDLTPYEQAQGFQMCLDLGMNEDELKNKTGFSKKTIRHRLKMLELDSDKVKKATEATIQDYIDLEKIEDIEKRNDLLDYIGTNDFRYKLTSTIESEKKRKLYEKGVEHLLSIMEQIEEKPEAYEYYMHLSPQSMNDFELPDNRKYVFIAEKNYYYAMIYVEKDSMTESDAENEENQEPTQDEINVERIKELVENAYQTRLEFARDVYNSLFPNLSKNMEFCTLFSIVSEKLEVSQTYTSEVFEEVTGLSLDEVDNFQFLSINKAVRLSFALAYASMENKNNAATVNTWYGNDYGSYKEWNADGFKILYEFLEQYGYKISEEEEQIIFGTHELYKKTED